jgi:hypothetical protein
MLGKAMCLRGEALIEGSCNEFHLIAAPTMHNGRRIPLELVTRGKIDQKHSSREDYQPTLNDLLHASLWWQEGWHWEMEDMQI